MAARKFPFKWLLVGAVLVVGGVIAPKLWHQPPTQAKAMVGMPVGVASVIAMPVTQWQEFSGVLEAVNSVQVRPRVGGQITAIHFADGAEVKKGQPLFTIDPRPYEAETSRTKGQLATAAAAQTQAAQDFLRASKLIKSKAISQSEYDQKASALKQASGALDTAKGALRMAEVNLGYAHITAPISGKISRAEITVGNLVEPAAAQLLASIVDLSPIYASFDVDEQSFLASIQGVPTAKLKAIPVEVILGNGQGGAMLKTRIHSFDNQISPASGTIRVRAVLPNTDGSLVAGLYARVRLGSNENAESLLVNPTAINTDQDKKFVLVVNAESKAEYRPVTLGGLVDGLQVVKTGLSKDEKIIVTGLQMVRPGAPITPTEMDMVTLTPIAAPAPAEALPHEKPAEAKDVQ